MECQYGCGKEAIHQLKNGKWCCSKSANSCEINKIKNSNKQKGRKHSELTKLKISIGNKGKEGWLKGKHHSVETIKKLKSHYFVFTEDHKRNLSKALKGKNRPKFSEEIIQKIREKNIGRKHSQETKNKISRINKGRKRSNEWIEKRRQYMLNGGAEHVGKFPKNFSEEFKQKQRERMLNGQSLYMNKCIKNPSKPEVMLRDMVKKLLLNCEFQYPVLNYSLDVALPDKKIAIEYDGYYHFDTEEHKEYHKQRQEKIEKEGWKFLRYTIFDKFPNIEKLKNDINQIL